MASRNNATSRESGVSRNPPVNPKAERESAWTSGHEEDEVPALVTVDHEPKSQTQDTNKLSPSRPAIPDFQYWPGQPKSLAGIALRAFCLGAALMLAVISTVWVLANTTNALWRVPFFLGALSAFHFLEFWTTAAYNTPQANVYAFLLTANWPAYAIAHAVATVECLITNIIWPNRTLAPFHLNSVLLLSGVVFVIVGQVVRSLAMITAGQSFNHTIQHYKAESHTLVTSGIYTYFRHPSYFGFFWWAIGTQLVMGNVFCFFAYGAVLYKFFSRRITHEEALLEKFFGQEYVEYRKRVPTLIPFCG